MGPEDRHAAVGSGGLVAEVFLIMGSLDSSPEIRISDRSRRMIEWF